MNGCANTQYNVPSLRSPRTFVYDCFQKSSAEQMEARLECRLRCVVCRVVGHPLSAGQSGKSL